jgi:transposase
MKKSRPYRTTDVKDICVTKLLALKRSGRCYVGLDCSKHEVVVVVRWEDGSFERPWQVAMTSQDLGLLVEKLEKLSAACEVVIALEPTGSYCDPIRYALHRACLCVYRVNPKSSHDFAEIFDGVPSQHDGKDAACVAELAAIGKCSQWPWQPDQPKLRREIEWADHHQETLIRWQGYLEGLLAQYWPELTQMVKLSSSTLLNLLACYGGRQALLNDPEARAQLRKWGGAKLSEKKIDQILESAAESIGVYQSDDEVTNLKRCAAEALRLRRQVNKSRRLLEKCVKNDPNMRAVAQVIGPVTTAVCWVELGNPTQYHYGKAYLKAMGLNLKERSSGRYQGQLRISKRGPSRPRRWLYLAALRHAQSAWVRPWFEAKKKRGRGGAQKALVALMRKLALAVYRVAQGREFHIQRLLPGARKYHPELGPKHAELRQVMEAPA